MTDESTCPRCGAPLGNLVGFVRMERGTRSGDAPWTWTGFVQTVVCERCGREIERVIARRMAML